ncbi:MAG: methyl-accepting chemotaxis protein [Treponema sp.]|nr:methyl-accepting chemotaxis protein [Treponema sp.]
MSLKIKLTSIIFVMILTVIAVLSVFMLTRASNLQTSTTFEYAEEMARANSIEIQRRIETITGYAKVLSQILSDFENTQENTRRDIYNEFLRSTIQQNEFVIGIWTAWLPDTIDSYDSGLGLYQTFYTRNRTGEIELAAEGAEGYDRIQGFLAEMNGKPAISPPVRNYVYGFGNIPIFTVMYPVKNSAGIPVGLIGINYASSMQEIVNEIVIEVFDGKGVAGVYTNDGVIIAHYDKTRIMDNINTNKGEMELLGDQHGRVVQSIRNGGDNGRSVVVTRYSAIRETDLHLIYEPIFIQDMDAPWSLLLGIPMNEINRPVKEMIIFAIVFAVFVLIVVSIISFFVTNRVVKPIINVANTLKDISEGEGDLTKRIDNNSKDEVGVLSHYFNDTLDKIKNLVVSIKTEASELSDIGNDLANNMNETAAAVNEITTNIQSIKGRVLNQSASVTQTNATMESVTGNIHKLNEHVENQSSHITQASAAIEQMVANVHSVTDTLIKNACNVESLREASEIGRNGLQTVAEDIQEIVRDSEGLLEINSVMDNIASQTNLLSMNAAIEAAHAGDAGKGFAVVADEIRKLAESSGEQSKTIGIVLKKIKESIDNITSKTENVINRFNAIDTGVKTVAQQEGTIRSAMEEQETGSRQILEGVSHVNELTRQVKSGSNEMLGGAREVICEGSNLEKITQEITSGMNEMATGANQINVAVNHVNDISCQNRERIAALMKEVSRFKVA